MVEVSDGGGDRGEQERLHSEGADVGHQPALTHHEDLQHQHQRRHQRDDLGAKLRIVPEKHFILKTEKSKSAPGRSTQTRRPAAPEPGTAASWRWWSPPAPLPRPTTGVSR